MRTMLLTLVLTAACGTEERLAQKDAPPSTEQSDSHGEQKEKIRDSFRSLLVAAQADLPECDADILGSLAYVEADSQFMACGKSGWHKVEIKGDKGEKGDQGVAGADGKTGATVELDTASWLDPITGKRWTGSPVALTHDDAVKSCGSWRLPTADEAFEAIAHGLLRDLTPPAGKYSAWSSDVGQLNAGYYMTIGLTGCGNPDSACIGKATGGNLGTVALATYCVK